MFEPSMETLLQISSFFNISLDLLCNGYSDTNDVLLRNTLEEVQQTYVRRTSNESVFANNSRFILKS